MTPEQSTPLLPVFGRSFWMILGPMLLIIILVASFEKGSGWFTVADIVLLAIFAGLILGRWCEFQGGNPQTSIGEPASSAHLRRYALGAMLVGIGVWVLANLFENHWLTQ